MRAVLQRVTSASVTIDGNVHSQIGKGLLILVGVGLNDSEEDIEWLSAKICGMRIFADAEGKMNLNVCEVEGDLLVVSQFTLFASTKKGNRPGFTDAARPETAIPLYEKFNAALHKITGKEVATGKFGADMKVSLINDGPVTIVVDTKNKE